MLGATVGVAFSIPIWRIWPGRSEGGVFWSPRQAVAGSCFTGRRDGRSSAVPAKQHDSDCSNRHRYFQQQTIQGLWTFVSWKGNERAYSSSPAGTPVLPILQALAAAGMLSAVGRALRPRIRGFGLSRIRSRTKFGFISSFRAH